MARRRTAVAPGVAAIQFQVAQVDGQAGHLSQADHQVALMGRIGQQQNRAGAAEVPEVHRHEALARASERIHCTRKRAENAHCARSLTTNQIGLMPLNRKPHTLYTYRRGHGAASLPDVVDSFQFGAVAGAGRITESSRQHQHGVSATLGWCRTNDEVLPMTLSVSSS
jgi:hypothetical protein